MVDAPLRWSRRAGATATNVVDVDYHTLQSVRYACGPSASAHALAHLSRARQSSTPEDFRPAGANTCADCFSRGRAVAVVFACGQPILASAGIARVAGVSPGGSARTVPPECCQRHRTRSRAGGGPAACLPARPRTGRNTFQTRHDFHSSAANRDFQSLGGPGQHAGPTPSRYPHFGARLVPSSPEAGGTWVCRGTPGAACGGQPARCLWANAGAPCGKIAVAEYYHTLQSVIVQNPRKTLQQVATSNLAPSPCVFHETPLFPGAISQTGRRMNGSFALLLCARPP